MNPIVFAFFAFVATVLAEGDAPPSTPIAILSQSQDLGPDGSFSSQFETANGISEQVKGSIKNIDKDTQIQTIEGSVSWTDQDGVVRKLTYIADENGYQPQADFLPTPPAVPLPIQRALDYAAANPEPTTVNSPAAANPEPTTVNSPAAAKPELTTVSSPAAAPAAVEPTPNVLQPATA